MLELEFPPCSRHLCCDVYRNTVRFDSSLGLKMKCSFRRSGLCIQRRICIKNIKLPYSIHRFAYRLALHVDKICLIELVRVLSEMTSIPWYFSFRLWLERILSYGMTTFERHQLQQFITRPTRSHNEFLSGASLTKKLRPQGYYAVLGLGSFRWSHRNASPFGNSMAKNKRTTCGEESS